MTGTTTVLLVDCVDGVDCVGGLYGTAIPRGCDVGGCVTGGCVIGACALRTGAWAACGRGAGACATCTGAVVEVLVGAATAGTTTAGFLWDAAGAT